MKTVIKKETKIMKKRKIVIVSFLIAAILLLGVGFAALADTLDITGTADINASAAEEAFNEDVYFSAVSSGEGYTANINANNNDKAQFTVTGLKGAGDEVTMTFTIKNAGDLSANIALKTTSNNNEEYFTVTHDLGSARTLTAGNETVVEVKVKLNKTPTETISGTFVIEIAATSVDA